LVTRELQGKCNQSCQQYRSNNSISPKPATKRFLIFQIELLIFIDELSAHRNPSISARRKMEKGYQLPAKPYVKQFTLNAAWLARCCMQGEKGENL
jgi:hypothetical protein